MDRTDRTRLVNHFKTVMRLWQRCADLEDDDNDTWKFRGEKQGYRDCMQSAKRAGLITEFRLYPPRVWFPDQADPVVCSETNAANNRRYLLENTEDIESNTEGA